MASYDDYYDLQQQQAEAAPIDTDAEDRNAQTIAASRPLPTQTIGGMQVAAPSDDEDTILPSPGQTPPPQATPSGAAWDPFRDGVFLNSGDEPAPPPEPSVVGELGSGLARGFKHTAAEVGDLAATAASKTGDWTDTTWLKNLGSTISDYDKGLTKVDPSAISSMTMAQARAKGVMTAWLVGKAAEQAVPLTSIIAMGTAMPLAPIIYGAAVGANEEAKNPDATGGSVATAAIGNAAMMGMPIHILQSAVGQTFFKKLAADVLGFAGLGAAGEFQEPATKAARGEGFEMPSLGQLGEGAVIGGMSGAMARPAQVGVNAVSRMLGRGKAGQPPPPVDADVQAATQQALPPPSPENRPDVMNVPPTGPDQMSSSDIIPPAAGTLDRPGDQAASADPDTVSALRFMLPPPSDANRAPAPDVVNVPPTGPGQVSASDIIPPPAGSVDYPPSPPPPTPPPGPLALPAPPPTPALPAPGPENRPPPAPEARPTMPVAPEAGQVSAADIMPPPAGTVDYPPPPVQQLALPAPDRASTVSMPGRVPGETDAITPPPGTVDYPTDVSFQMPAALRMKLSQPERWQVEPDDATPGQYVVKHGNDVLAVGSSPEEAMQAAHDRAQRLEVGGAPTDIGTGAEATTSSEPGTTPIVAGENTPEIPPPPVEAPPETPKTKARAKLKPAAQEVLSKADQKLAAARAAGDTEPVQSSEPTPEQPPGLMKLVKKVAAAKAAKAAPEPAPEPASALVRETPAQRKARIAREVKGEFGETAKPPAGATPAARGMENIDLVSAAAGTRDPREAARASGVETTGENLELKSDQRAASTTDLRLRAGDLLHDVFKGELEPHEAYEAYGEPAGTGRPRRYATFLDYLKSRVESANDPDAERKLLAEAKAISENASLSEAQRKRAIEPIGREIERRGVEQDNLPEMEAHVAALEDYVGAPEAEPEVKPKLTQDQLLQKMKDAIARKKAGTLKSSFSSYERGSHLDVLERLFPNENVEDRLAHTAETGVPHDMHAYLDDIINSTQSRATPHLLAVARVLRKRLAPGIMVHADPHLDAYGEYNPDTDAVTIRPGMGVSVRTIVHEALHAGTAHFLTDVGTRLRDGKPVTPDERRAYRALDAVGHEIDGISSGAVQMTRAGEAARDARQYRNHHELITYAMTDPHLLGLMANTDASPMLLRRLKQVGLEPVGPKPSLLAAFKTAIGKLFGLTPDRVSVLDAVMRPIERAVEMGTDYRSERTGPGERTPVLQSKLTDNLPDPLRQKLSGFGNIVEGFNRDGLLGKTRDLIREIPRYGRQAGLMASGTNSAVRWNRDIPGLKTIRDLRALAERKSKDAQLQWGDRVHDYAQELARAGTAFSDFRNRVSMAEVNVRDPDFNRANAHLRTDEARQLGLELKAEHDRLPPELQQLHDNITTMEARWRYDQDRGWMEHLLRRAGGDLTKEDLSELAHIVGDKAKMDQLAKDPDQSHLADLMADRWAAVRPIAQQFAKIQSAGWRHGDFTSLQRHGDYVVTHGDPEIPEHYGVYAFERSSQAEQFRHEFMTEKNPDGTLKNAGITPSQVKLKFAAGSNRYREFMPSTMETELKRTLELRGIRGEAADGFMDAFTAYLLQSGARATALRSVARRNITGASTDGMKNLIRNYQAHASRMGHLATAADEYAAYQQTENQVRQVERAYHGTPQEIAESKARLVALEQRYANKDPEVSQAEIEDRRRQHELLSKPLGRGDAMRARQAFEEMKLRRAPVDGDDSARLFGVTARKFMATSFVTQLVRPAHLAVMSLDAANNAQAYLGAEYGHGRAAVALGRALKQLTPTGMGAGWGNMVKAFHGQMRQADWRVSQQMEQRWIDTGMDKDDAHALMEYARDRNAVDTSMERETHRFATEGGLDVALGHAHRIANNMMTLFASAEHSLDTLNRSIILKAGYDLALEKNGGDKAAAIRAAVDHVDDAMMNFAAWNKPRVMTERGPIKNPLVAATMQYKVYGAQMYSHMATLAMEAATDPSRRSVAIQSLAGMLAINSLLIGALPNMFGVPINAITGLWDMVNGKSGPHNYENDLRRWATHTLGPTASAFLSRGLIGVAGADLHRSLKRSNMVDVPELRDFTKAGVGAFFAQGLTGASGELAGQYVDATSKMFNGNFAQGALELMPRPIADVSRAYHEATTGVTDAKGNVIVPASRLSMLTPIIRGIGFNPTAVATPLANRAAENEFERERTDARNKAEAAFVQNRDMSRVRAFNVDKELNGGVPIKPADLLRALKTQQDRLATPGTYGLRFPKALVPAATRAGQFS